jgi:DNA (cytosine-5)-methyltransferase 1
MKVVDLFAGAGGSSTGATQAGMRVVAAVNHWRRAVETHRVNHPQTAHFCQDAALMDPRQLPAYDVLLASPECRGHAKAKGKERPHHDKSRATAWCVVNVAEITRPAALVVENVPELRQWNLYRHWRGALESLGYRLTENVLDAADFGVPQHRVRLFIVGMQDRRPEPVEAPKVPLVPIRKALNIDAGRWSPVAGHCANTIERARRGRRDCGPVFVMPYYGSGSGETGRSIDRPLGTVTTRDRWAIVRDDEMRMLTPAEYKAAMGFPASYQLTGSRAEQIHQLGNAVAPPVMRALCRAIGEAA